MKEFFSLIVLLILICYCNSETRATLNCTCTFEYQPENKSKAVQWHRLPQSDTSIMEKGYNKTDDKSKICRPEKREECSNLCKQNHYKRDNDRFRKWYCKLLTGRWAVTMGAIFSCTVDGEIPVEERIQGDIKFQIHCYNMTIPPTLPTFTTPPFNPNRPTRKEIQRSASLSHKSQINLLIILLMFLLIQ